jgi:heat shock protein hsp90-like protein
VKKGNLSIHSENLFPIIKKWLYSDHDIFVRELVSNATDAITKLKKLALIGEFNAPEDEKYSVQVEISPSQKVITITDNGIGMTEDEIDEYINQIAFSGAQDFIEKYKDKASDDQIIGHFGLGFYSAFMVADKVTIDTLSYKEGAKAVKWSSDGGTEYEMGESDRTERGTSITLYLNDESHEFANAYRVREVLEKYCSFMPVEIFLKDLDEKVEENPEKENEKKEEPKPINDIHPLWNRHPNECSKEDYIAFYQKVFHDYKEPLFWIHLNMDYPFHLKGILYFPKIGNQYESIEGTIKLYNTQVFIADNIKEVIPEFLMLLKGVIDCPDLPLNVSRSALQNDGFVKKISDYITKKVADKLVGMCKVDRESYEKYWDDLSPFIKFGCLKDEKFEEKMKDSILFKDLDDKYTTLRDLCGEEQEKTLYYVTDVNEQSQYIKMFKEAGKNAVILSDVIDSAFIGQLEYKNKGLKFLRIDADIQAALKQEDSDEETKKKYDEVAKKVKEEIGDEKLNVEIQTLQNNSIASMITLSEESRRMQDMMKQYAMPGMNSAMFDNGGRTLVLNVSHPLVKQLVENTECENFALLSEQLYDLASLGHGSLSPERLEKFIQRTNELMEKLNTV